MWKLKYFKCFVRRMNDLSGKRIGKRVKDNVEAQLLRAKMREVWCEENMRRNWRKRKHGQWKRPPKGGECNGLT